MIRQAEQGQHGTPRAVGYLRRSTDRQEQSIGDQRRAVAEYVHDNGMDLTDWYVDDAISGTSTTGRKAFRRMIDDAQDRHRRFDVIVVYDVKRFGRLDNDEAGYYRYLLRRCGVSVHYVTENFSDDGTDDLLRPVKQWQARQESKDLAKVTIRGMVSQFAGTRSTAKPSPKKPVEASGRQNGWWLGGCPPYGYDLRYESGEGEFLFTQRFMPDGSKQLFDDEEKLIRTLPRHESLNISKRDRCRLTPSAPERVAAVQRMFHLYAEQSRGVKAVTETLNSEGVPTPRGPAWSPIYSGRWAVATVRAILIKPIYVGDLVWNRRSDGRFYRIAGQRAVERRNVHGARLVPNDPRDWMTIYNAHKPLISRRLFEKVQTRIKDRARQASGKSGGSTVAPGEPTFKRWNGKRNRFLLSGLLRCAQCGTRYQGFRRTKGKRRVDGSRVYTYSYGCGGYINRGKSTCRLGSILKQSIEAAVKAEVFDYYRPYLEAGGRDRLARRVRKHLGQESVELAEARQRLEGEQAQLKQAIDNLLDNLTATNREFIDERLAGLKRKQEKLQARAEQLERLELDDKRLEDTVADAAAVIGKLEQTFEQSQPEQQRNLLRQCLTDLQIDARTRQVTLTLRPVPLSSYEGSDQRQLHLPPASGTCPYSAE